MNGGQDLGGEHGFGPVEAEPDEPVFHAEWEKRAFALTLAMGMPGGWNIDMGRFARENRDPADYLAMTYYQLWFAGLETLLKERDLVADDELAAGHALTPPKPVKRILTPDDVLKDCIVAGRPSARPTPRRHSRPATRCGRRISTHSPTRGCRATCVGTRRDRARASSSRFL